METTLTIPKKGATQPMIITDPDDSASFKVFSALIKKMTEDLYPELFNNKIIPGMIETHPDHGITKVMFGDSAKADRFVNAVIKKYGTTFSLRRSSDLFVTIHHRIMENPPAEFLSKYGEFFQKIKDYKSKMNGESLPIKDFPAYLEGVAETSTFTSTMTNGDDGTETWDIRENGSGFPVQLKEEDELSNSETVVVSGTGNQNDVSSNADNNSDEKFFSLTIGQQNLLVMGSNKLKNGILLKAFRTRFGELESFPTVAKNEGAVMCLSIERMDDLIKYLDCIGIKYKFKEPKYKVTSPHRIICILGNVPKHADEVLMKRIKKAIGQSDTKIEKTYELVKQNPTPASTSTVVNTPVEGFTPLTEEQKESFRNKSTVAKHTALHNAFRSKVGDLKNFGAKDSHVENAVMYLSVENGKKRDVLTKYLDAIGIGYQPGKSEKTIILFDNVPTSADAKLIGLINKAIEVKIQLKPQTSVITTEEPVVKTKEEEPVAKQQTPPSPQLVGLNAATIEALEKIPEKLQQVEMLMNLLTSGIEQIGDLKDLATLQRKAFIQQNATAMATAIANRIINDTDQIIIIKDNVSIFSKANLIRWAEEELKKFV